MKMQPKIDQQSTKNRPKTLQKTIKNPPKMDLGGLLGPLGVSWAVWAASQGSLGASRPRPGASWGRLGGQHGPNLAPKTEPTSIKKTDAKIDHFF